MTGGTIDIETCPHYGDPVVSDVEIGLTMPSDAYGCYTPIMGDRYEIVAVEQINGSARVVFRRLIPGEDR